MQRTFTLLQFSCKSREGSGELLASEFAKFVSTSGIKEPMRYRRPTPMIPPNLAVQSIMTALQMNDYPEEDAGARTAYLFSKPYDCKNLVAGQVSACKLQARLLLARIYSTFRTQRGWGKEWDVSSQSHHNIEPTPSQHLQQEGRLYVCCKYRLLCILPRIGGLLKGQTEERLPRSKACYPYFTTSHMQALLQWRHPVFSFC